MNYESCVSIAKAEGATHCYIVTKTGAKLTREAPQDKKEEWAPADPPLLTQHTNKNIYKNNYLKAKSNQKLTF